MINLRQNITSFSVITLALISFGAGVFTFSCVSDDHPNVVARVGDYKMTQQELDSSSVPLQTLNSWIETSLLAMEAENRGLDRIEDFKFVLEQVRKNLLVEYLMDSETAKLVEPTPEEIENYYLENEKEFKRAELEVEIYYFSSLNPDNLRNIRNSLRKGEDPSKLAESYPGLQSGRELIVDPASKHAPYASFASDAVGTVTGPTQIGNRYYVFKIVERFEPGTTTPLSQVKDEIVYRIKSTKEQEMREKLVKELRNEYSVTIKYERLKAAGITTGESQ